MKKLTFLILTVFLVATSICYAEPRETYDTLQSARHRGATMVVEHATAVEELRTDGIQKNELKRQKIQGGQYRNKEGYAPTEYNTDMADQQVAGVQQGHQQSQALYNKQRQLSGGKITASTPKFKTPQFSRSSRSLSSSQMSMSMPKFKPRSAKMNALSLPSGQAERRVLSTNSALSNMQIRYMNKVMEGRVDYAVNQGGRR